MPNSVTRYKGVVNFAFKRSGWSETYWLASDNAEAAVTNFIQGVGLRAAWMGGDVELIYAHVSLSQWRAPPLKDIHDSFLLEIPYPLTNIHLPGAAPMVVQNPWDALMFRLQTAEGLFASRFLRGIPDTYVTSLVAQVPNVSVTTLGALGVAIPDPAGNSNLQTRQRGFLTWVRDRTLKVKRLADHSYDFQPWDKCIYVRVGKHATGRPFGMYRGRAYAQPAAPAP